MATERKELPLLAVLEETVFPGEERILEATAFDAATIAFVQTLEGDGLGQPFGPAAGGLFVLVSVTASAEVPLLVSGRHATVARFAGLSGGCPTFVGLERVRIAKARGTKPPYVAEVDPPSSELPTGRDLLGRPLLEAAAALVLGPAPLVDSSGSAGPGAALQPVAAAVLRALDGGGARRALADGDLVGALAQHTKDYLADAASRTALTDLERHVGELVRAGMPTKPLRQRLHSAVVEIARRLDLYDTTRVAGDDLDELDTLRRKLDQGLMPPHARVVAEREYKVVRAMKTDHHDYASHLRLVQLLARLAWHPDTLPPIDLARVAAVLDRDHAGLQRPKRRILEYLAVRALGGEGRSTVLCLAGPPGVGKTSIARAMAEALGRPFVRIALGGVYDQSELRGHRITYTAARPGRIIEGLAQVRSRSALVLLDELDKVGTDKSRDVTGPLLEILDPEQNHSFSDNFLTVAYDLSDCLFVATANDLSRMPDYLKDRLEILELDGYTTQEKVDIAERHLASSLAREHGIAALGIDPAVVGRIIEGWTREAGVRQLRRELAGFYRERAVERVFAGAPSAAASAPSAAVASPLAGTPPDGERAVVDGDLERVLGPKKFRRAERSDRLPPGVAMGLSVSGYGGQLLPLELVTVGRRAAADGDARMGRFEMTGSLGAVMKESAHVVRAHLVAYRERYGIGSELASLDLHLHAPEGAVPKDGPSAGVALFLAMLSLASGRPVRPDVAVTGELDLSGRVLPVGGIRAKCLAAERAQMALVLVPRDNRADVPSDLTIAVGWLTTAEDALVALLPAS